MLLKKLDITVGVWRDVQANSIVFNALNVAVFKWYTEGITVVPLSKLAIDRWGKSERTNRDVQDSIVLAFEILDKDIHKAMKEGNHALAGELLNKLDRMQRRAGLVGRIKKA